jgi:hypothetical protein
MARQRKYKLFIDQFNISGIRRFDQMLYDNSLLFYQILFSHHYEVKSLTSPLQSTFLRGLMEWQIRANKSPNAIKL